MLEVVQGLAVEPGVDARTQDRRVERLGQEVVRAGLETPDAGDIFFGFLATGSNPLEGKAGAPAAASPGNRTKANRLVSSRRPRKKLLTWLPSMLTIVW